MILSDCGQCKRSSRKKADAITRAGSRAKNASIRATWSLAVSSIFDGFLQMSRKVKGVMAGCKCRKERGSG